MSNDLRKELCDRFVAATVSLYRLVYIGLQDFRKDLGQNELVNQYKALMLLAHQGPLSVGQIAVYLSCTDSTINEVLRRLDRKKMIDKARSSHDRRVVICELTPEGRKVLDRIDHVVRKRVLPSTETWSLEQLEAFVESMESIHPDLEYVEPRPLAESESWFIRKYY